MSDNRTGFTGSRAGLTPHQKLSLDQLMNYIKGWWHHGDCKGADEDSHFLARMHGLSICIHPPSNDSMRAWCVGDAMEEPKDYIPRNHDIVDATRLLIAAPATEVEELRSGTWSTVRYARKIGRPRLLIYPDGRMIREDRDVQ